ncbi:ATP binding microtubule motor family protein [Hibiscus syriacus]|uniref:ATP binding microtubule motor family protein n=1 Tax=Hibiscus syriacus TaxID=106335 RepID=A0A6A2WDL7_HIBSY|nr:ATP binding microtubule motor family protein [Hibiscus syriacus]
MSTARNAMETNTATPSSTLITVRRNPHRKVRSTALFNASRLRLQSTSSSELPQISSFPIQDILSEKILQNSPAITAASPSPPQDSVLENLKVFLRIRPLVPLKGSKNNTVDQHARSRTKNVWPQNPSKKNSVKEKKNPQKKSNDSCITVSQDFCSVILSPPLHLQETKRVKSEVYEGFSYVFSDESTQSEVYEKMMNPLVEDFLNGKSGMLAALGSTGSGKTHTIFGSSREPGMAISLIYFEICAERGKTERICDLTSERPDLSMQQSTIKGLEEVLVHDVAEAESLIARALLRRSTAMTNANSKSSRSQCIINIRGGTEMSDPENDKQSNSAVLSIVDLAGAEREKRTGNQGARLAESNFINNTSMVFGLCLKSLLEHQKNPKKALQKHFQNSLLTRYLRDYLEGKKRMTLTLSDTVTFPFRFANIEAQSNLLRNKRQIQTSKVEQSKRMKFGNLDASMIEKKIVEDGNRLPDEGDLTSCGADLKSSTPLKLMKERTHQITQRFAKALWNVLKQHNEKLKVVECENQILRENLRNEKKRSIEMEKELKDLRSCCTCSKDNSAVSTDVKVAEDFEFIVLSEVQKFCGIDEVLIMLYIWVLNQNIPSNLNEPECIDGKREHEAMLRNLEADARSPSICDSSDNSQSDKIPESFLGTENIHEDSSESNNVVAEHLDPNSHETVRLSGNESSTSVQSCQQLGENNEDSLDLLVSHKQVDLSDNSQGCQIPESFPGTENIHEDSSYSNNVVAEHLDLNSHETVRLSGNGSSATVKPYQQLGENNEDLLDLLVSHKHVDSSDNNQGRQIPESFLGTENIHEVSIRLSGDESCTSVQPCQQLGENNEDSLDLLVSHKHVDPSDNNQGHQIPESFHGTENIHDDSTESNNVVTEHLDLNSHETARLSGNGSSASLKPCQQLGENDEDSLYLLVTHKHVDSSDNNQGLQLRIPKSFPGTENIHEDSSESNNVVVEHLDPDSHETIRLSGNGSSTFVQPCKQLGENVEDSLDLLVSHMHVDSSDNNQGCQLRIPESFPGTENIHEYLNESNNVVAERLDPNSHETFRLADNESSTYVQPCKQLGVNDEDSLDLSVSHKHVEQSQHHDLTDVPEGGVRPNTSRSSSKMEKPKRRLLPKSSILVREISTYDADEIDKPKGNVGRKNLAAAERQRTQGSISLLQLLKNNLHL